MTNIQEELKNKVELFSNKDKAIEYFAEQKGELEKISSTKGFKMIQEFWLLQYKNALIDFDNVDLDNTTKLAEIRARKTLADKYISWLDVRQIKTKKD